MKKTLSEIKAGALSRGLALAKLTAQAGTQAATHALGGLFSDGDSKAERARDLLLSQVQLLATQLGELKGTLQKAGQMLSMYGEHLLPPEANALLKSLQSQSPPLSWEKIHQTLQAQLSAEKLAELEIDETSIASASLGQVHLATRKSDGARIALKVQYPGVDRAIDTDIQALKRLLSLSKLIPGGPKYDQIFQEVREMLLLEVDYGRELRSTQEFAQLLADDSGYVVPKTYPEYSTERVLATSYEPGEAVDSPRVRALSQERRNRLAELALDLFFRELFVWRKVQTDPHFGNYGIRIVEPAPDGTPRDQIVLLDFGAVREFEPAFVAGYAEMVAGASQRDVEKLKRGAFTVGFITPDDSKELVDSFVQVCLMIIEPFGGVYAWGARDLPREVLGSVKELAKHSRLRPPPREIVFLDRKLGGMYVFISALRAVFDARPVLNRRLP